jgi:hypothetical protein
MTAELGVQPAAALRSICVFGGTAGGKMVSVRT